MRYLFSNINFWLDDDFVLGGKNTLSKKLNVTLILTLRYWEKFALLVLTLVKISCSLIHRTTVLSNWKRFVITVQTATVTPNHNTKTAKLAFQESTFYPCVSSDLKRFPPLPVPAQFRKYLGTEPGRRLARMRRGHAGRQSLHDHQKVARLIAISEAKK